MNNAKFAVERASLPQDPDVDNITFLREREAVLVNLISALAAVSEIEGWKFIEREIFDTALQSAKHKLENESKASELNAPNIYRLQGEIKTLERFGLKKLLAMYRTELIGVRNQLKTHG